MPSFSPKQRGVILVMVLWILMLMGITVHAFAALARTENLQGNQVVWGTRARLAAEAGLQFAIIRLRHNEIEQRWQGDGRAYQATFAGATLDVRVIDERGKVDLNTADELTLGNLLIAQDLEEIQVLELVDAILDWRDGDELSRVYGAEEREYSAQGLAYKPANGPFNAVEELQQVLGMTYDIYSKLEPALTVHSRSGRVDAAFAPKEALLSLPGMTEELADEFIAQRESIEPTLERDASNLTLPDGTNVFARGVGNVHTIKIKATMPNGIWDEIEATVSLTRQGNKPYQVLRWREGGGA